MGLGVLCFNVGGHEQLIQRVNMYREGLKHVQPIGAFVNDQVAALCLVHCGENDEEAKKVAGLQGEWFLKKANEAYRLWHEPGAKVPDSYNYLVGAVKDERVGKTAEDHMESGAFAMGDPDTCIKTVKGYEEAGVDQMLCLMQMGNLPHSNIMDSMKLFAKYVIPCFR